MIIDHLFDQVGHHLHIGHHCLHILLLVGKCPIEEVVTHLSKLMILLGRMTDEYEGKSMC